jgi:hypothetical protein
MKSFSILIILSLLAPFFLCQSTNLTASYSNLTTNFTCGSDSPDAIFGIGDTVIVCIFFPDLTAGPKKVLFKPLVDNFEVL